MDLKTEVFLSDLAEALGRVDADGNPERMSEAEILAEVRKRHEVFSLTRHYCCAYSAARSFSGAEQ